MNKLNIKLILLSMVIMLIGVTSVIASSHREAPLISNDPLADNVDLYAFKSPDNPDMISIIATYVPMQLPQGGPNYYSFGENVRYEVHVDNDAAIAGDEITYRFTFSMVHEDPTTFFYVRLGKQNSKMTYTLERSVDGGQSFQTIITDGYVPPNNIGTRSITSAVGLNTTYDALFANGITTASTGETVFAGPTDDPFFVDLAGIFDLGDAPRQVGQNVDALACYNVSAIAIQVPINTLKKASAPAMPTNILDGDFVIGVWASASRPAITTLSATADPAYSGDWIQVSRLGMPLTNEAVIPVGAKDFWNTITPYEEISETTLDEYFYNPELALYMDDDLFGGAVPAFAPLRIQTNSLGMFDFSNGSDGLYGLKGNPALAGTALDDAVFGTLLLPAPGKPRSVDLWPAFHTGVPNVIPYQLATGKGGNPLAAGKPFVNNFLPNGGDMLRLNMAVPATQRDDASFSSMGLINAAVLGLTAAPYNTSTDIEFIPNMDGFPNGRRLEDDVTRIELQAVSGAVLAAIGLWYDDYDPTTSPSPVTQDLLNVLTYTTGVESNDVAFTTGFPYLAQPRSGTGECSGVIYTGAPEDAATPVAKFFVSSNTQGKVGTYDLLTDRSVDNTVFVNQGADADGIYYNEDTDVLYQLNRTNNVIDVYQDALMNLNRGLSPSYVGSSTSDFTNGREIAVAGSKLVVAQDANDANGQVNQFVVYDIDGTTITLDKTFASSINLWGIHLDGNTMYAIEDNSSNVVTYANFFSRAAGTITPTSSTSIEGMGRTHGITYVKDGDIIVLTDVADAGSATDGAFTMITGYADASSDNNVTLAEQIRIAGPNSSLGNPVDIAVDVANNAVFIAERASSGGKVLAFDIPTASGDMTPFYNEAFAGASGIYLQGSTEAFMLSVVGDFFVSSNTSGTIGVANVLEDRSVGITSFTGAAMDADGIYYDDATDVLYQLNRTDNVLNAYSDVKATLAVGGVPTVSAISTSDFTNGREIAVAGEFIVVAQDANDANGQTNRLYVYQASATSIVLKNTYDVDVNLWGIHANTNTLYAIVDNSNRVAVYENFFLNGNGSVTPDLTVEVTDLVRTHGITYDATSDLMILTDVADADSGTDGALITVANFTSASADGTITAAEQIRIAGDATSLGNPVDVAYDAVNDNIYVAERKAEGGLVLTFENPTMGGNVAPNDIATFAGASAIYMTGAAVDGNPLSAVIDINGEEVSIDITPNPTADFLQIAVSDELNLTAQSTLTIYGMDGKLMMQQTLSQTNARVDVTSLLSGIYTIVLNNESYTYQSKFIKI